MLSNRHVVGVGSCLSERVLTALSKHHAFSASSMVRHNRSDQIVKWLTDGVEILPSLEELYTWLDGECRTAASRTEEELVLRGQARDTIGRSTLPELMPIANAVKRHNDLVVIDNYMDCVAKLWRREGSYPFFAHLKPDERSALERVSRLSPDVAAQNYRIIAETLSSSTSAKVVFIHFPFNGYSRETTRPQWAEDFAQYLSLPKEMLVIGPTQLDPRDFIPNQPNHFKRAIYEKWADEIAKWLNLETTEIKL